MGHIVSEMLVRIQVQILSTLLVTEVLSSDEKYSPEFLVQNRNINLKVISLQIIFKVVRLDELICGLMCLEKIS